MRPGLPHHAARHDQAMDLPGEGRQRKGAAGLAPQLSDRIEVLEHVVDASRTRPVVGGHARHVLLQQPRMARPPAIAAGISATLISGAFRQNRDFGECGEGDAAYRLVDELGHLPCTRRAHQGASTGVACDDRRNRSNASRSPPHITTKVLLATPGAPPETGASIHVMPRASRKRAAISRVACGAMLEWSTKNRSPRGAVRYAVDAEDNLVDRLSVGDAQKYNFADRSEGTGRVRRQHPRGGDRFRFSGVRLQTWTK